MDQAESQAPPRPTEPGGGAWSSQFLQALQGILQVGLSIRPRGLSNHQELLLGAKKEEGMNKGMRQEGLLKVQDGKLKAWRQNLAHVRVLLSLHQRSGNRKGPSNIYVRLVVSDSGTAIQRCCCSLKANNL